MPFIFKMQLLLNFFYNSTLLFLLTHNCNVVNAQSNFQNEVINALKDNSQDQCISRAKAHTLLNNMELKTMNSLLSKVNMQVAQMGNPEITTRFEALNTRLLFYKLDEGDSLYAATMKNCLRSAYMFDNEYMIAEYSRWYGEMLNTLRMPYQSVQNLSFAVKMQQRLGIEHFYNFGELCLNLGGLLSSGFFHKESIKYINLGFKYLKPGDVKPEQLAWAYTQLNENYRNTQQYKKELDACLKCMEISKKHGLMAMYYTCSDNRFDAYFNLHIDDSAAVIANNLHKYAIENKDELSLAASYYMLAQVNATEIANAPKVIDYYKKAEALYNKNNLQLFNTQIYRNLSRVYDRLGDSANKRYYSNLRDKNNEYNLKKRSEIDAQFLLVKAEYEEEQLKFKQLYKKSNSKLLGRNVFIALFVIAAAVIIYLINRRRKLAINQKRNTEYELKALKDAFNAKLIALQTEQKPNEPIHLHNKAEMLEILKKITILTPQEWEEFQTGFNQIFPGFLFQLKETYAGITEAEIRMALLMRIQLNNKQIANQLGISPDSVTKTKQRLRKRLNIESNTELEAFINAMIA